MLSSIGTTRRLETLLVPIDSLKPHPSNARQGDIEAIKTSVRANGVYRPIITARGTILAGHHLWYALKDLGHAEAPIIDLDLDPEGPDARRVLLADNRTAELGGYDNEALLDLLVSLDDLDGTGYKTDDLRVLQELLASLDTSAGGDPDSAPEPPPDPESALGDVWLLGPHRIACGSATDAGIVASALGGRTIDLMVTDPPYGQNYDGTGIQRNQGRLRDKIANDAGTEGLVDLLTAAYILALTSMRDGAAWYCFSPSGDAHLEHRQAWRGLGYKVDGLIWLKHTFVLGGADFHGRYEPFLYGFKGKRAQRVWNGQRTQDDVFEHNRPNGSPLHPTMKPVALLEQLVALSSRKDQLVYDPFSGSGSTLIAADRLGRVFAGVELEPKYVDVICRRYEEQTGIIPIRESDGEEHSFLTVTLESVTANA